MKYISEDKIYCYPNGVLKNKFKIHDENILNDIETEITTIHLTDMYKNPVNGEFDFSHYKKIHKKIFGDIYPFAGKTRTVSMTKGSTTFCIWMYIDEQCKTVFDFINEELLINEKYKKISKNDFIDIVAKAMIEINLIHPFREGNGRTLREYFRLLCLYCGYEIFYENSSKDEILEADIKGAAGTDSLLKDVLNKSLIKV